LDKALADHNMAILLYGVEVEIVRDTQTTDQGKFLQEAALAHRIRAGCLEQAGKPVEAANDQKYALKLEEEAKKLVAEKEKEPIRSAASETITANPPDKNGQPAFQDTNTPPKDNPQPKKRGFRLFSRD
jgi:hypothetical protein